jgi:hypothetical protein
LTNGTRRRGPSSMPTKKFNCKCYKHVFKDAFLMKILKVIRMLKMSDAKDIIFTSTLRPEKTERKRDGKRGADLCIIECREFTSDF